MRGASGEGERGARREGEQAGRGSRGEKKTEGWGEDINSQRIRI